jgi:hypothetical protein
MKIILFLTIIILLMMNFFKINSIPTNIVNLNEYFDIMNDDYDYTVGESDEQLGRKKNFFLISILLFVDNRRNSGRYC